MFEELKRGEATVLFGTFGTRLLVPIQPIDCV
jgi:hypothetical protein